MNYDAIPCCLHCTFYHLYRHYGALQGLDKQQTVQKYGKDQVLVWRRSYDVPPPACETRSPMLPVNDPKYAGLPEAQLIKTESLKVSFDVMYHLWKEHILTSMLFLDHT